MSKALIMNSFAKGCVPSVSKVVEDARKMMSLAKYLIVLDAKGKIVSSSTPFDEVRAVTVPCLLVVAPVEYKGVKIAHAVVLEIGFNRFVPYAQSEYQLKVNNNTKVCAVKERHVVASISPNALITLMPEILSIIQSEVTSRIQKWRQPIHTKKSGVRKYSYNYDIPALAFVRFPKNATLLHYGALLYDQKWRTGAQGNLWARAEQIREWLTQFMKLRVNHKTQSGEYTESVVKNSVGLAKLSDVLRVFQLRHERNPGYVRLLENMVHPNPKSSYRVLLKQVRVLHKVPNPKRSYDLEKMKREFALFREELEQIWHLHTVIDAKRNRKRLVHAQGCLVVGVASPEAQNKTLRLLHNEQDADIPF